MNPLKGSSSFAPDRKRKKTLKREGAFRTLLEQEKNSPILPSWVTATRGVLDGSEELESLLDNVHSSGDALRKRPTMALLTQYRDDLGRFLRFVLTKGLEVEHKLGLKNPKTMQQKRYALVKVIDRRLGELADAVVTAQKNEIFLSSKLQEIHGLLVDLLE